MLSININEGGGATISHGGVVKPVNIKEFTRLIHAEHAVDLGLLPPGIRYLAAGASVIKAAVEVPAARYDICVHENSDQRFEKVGLPTALFFFELCKRNGANGLFEMTKSYVYALAGNRLMFGMDRLYKYPIPNVYPEGRICWGYNDTNLRGIKTIAGLGGIVNTFFGAPFNNDLFSMGSVSSSFPWDENSKNGRGSASNYASILSGEDFNPEWLSQAPPPYTSFNNALNSIFQR